VVRYAFTVRDSHPLLLAGLPAHIGFVTAGLMNKQIAAELGVSEITVKVHRGKAMKKMGARSLADLVRMAETLGIRRRKP
jgi:ATP/maltotriose-dependent transcriptional regulator MalT